MLPKTLPAFFWHFIRKDWKQFLAVQLFCFSWALDHTLWPVVLMMTVDTLTNFQGDRVEVWSALTTPIILSLTLWIGVEVCYRLAGFLLAQLAPRKEAEIRMSMYDYVQRHSYLYFSKKLAGGVANKISDMTLGFTKVMQLILNLFVPVILALAIAITLFSQMQPLFALMLVVWLVVHIGISLSFAKKCDHFANAHAESRSTMAGKIVDSLTNNMNVRLFSRQSFERSYLSDFQQEERKKHTYSLTYLEKMKAALSVAAILGVGIGIFSLMIYMWQQEKITTGEVVFIFNTTWNITMMVWLAGLELPNLFQEIGICRQALCIIQDEHDIVDAVDAKPLKVTCGEIVFENVTFNYTSNQNIFEDKNLVITAGSKVGLVGFSGSGKSTFVNLILRYFDVEGGRILIDGQDIARVTQNSLREQIALIPQDTSLFHRTIMENIRYGRLEATDNEVVEAAIKANSHEFIEKMANRYQTVAGERGMTLSGGQRQRIAIARAILKNAPIFILDEATSSLDSVTEKKIQDGLEVLMDGRTCIVIAHRLSTLCNMDRILVFKEGKIVEDGTHADLLAAEGHYALMWNMQAGGFLPDSTECELSFPSRTTSYVNLFKERVLEIY
jgi:ATP-binding cassette subfamily B protein